MSYFVYILRSEKTDRFYIGQTNNVVARLKRHNAGYEKATKTYCPWVLYFVIEVGSCAEALKLERSLKNMKSHQRILDWVEKHL